MSTQFLPRPDGRLAYDDSAATGMAGTGGTAGNPGPLVVCTPSMGDLRAEYRFLTPLLVTAGYRVVTLDVRGHGESTTGWPDYSVAAIGDDILALARHLDAGPALLIGESMAAGAAVWAAAAAPELVRGLVLIGPFVRGEGSWATRLLYGALFARPWGPAAWQRYYTMLYPTRKPADFAAYSAALRANLAQPGRLEALHAMLAASKSASAQRLDRVHAPTLVLMGTKDPDFKQPAVEAQWVADRLNGALHLIEGAGHYPHAELPEVTAPLIMDFFATVTGETIPAQPISAQERAHAA